MRSRASTPAKGLSELFEYRIEAVSSEAGPSTSMPPSAAIAGYRFGRQSGNDRIFDGLLVEAQWLGLARRRQSHLPARAEAVAVAPVAHDRLPHLREQECSRHCQRGLPRLLASTTINSHCTTSYPTLEYCVQYRETDLAFVSRLMEEYGIYYYFRA